MKTIQSVDRACAIVEALCEHENGLSLGDLANRTGLAPQTAQSLLRTLQANGWVTQAGRGRPYLPGPALLRSIQDWLNTRSGSSHIRDRVAALARETGEYTLLAELRGCHLFPLAEVKVERSLMLGKTEFGSERVHAMATGQMLLASLTPEDRRRLVAALPLPRRGPRTYTDRETFLRHLEQIGTQSHCLCRNQAGEHIAALAVPVRDFTGKVAAALGLSIPEARFAPQRQTCLLDKLRVCAADLEKFWGGA